jgi:hypothetical protein
VTTTADRHRLPTGDSWTPAGNGDGNSGEKSYIGVAESSLGGGFMAPICPMAGLSPAVRRLECLGIDARRLVRRWGLPTPRRGTTTRV